MKSATAVLISGNVRSFTECFPSQLWHVYRKLERPHFFVSVVDEPGSRAVEVLREHFAQVSIEYLAQPALESTPEMEAARAFAPYGNSVPTAHFLRWMWHQARVWELFLAGRRPGFEYGTFIRMRCDLMFQRFDLPEVLEPVTVHVPWWGNYGGCNDRLALITSEVAASVYFTIFDQVSSVIAAGCPCHPESILAGVLELRQVPVSRTLPAEFFTKRAAGDRRPDAHPVYYAGDIFRYVEARLAQQLRAQAGLSRS